VKDGKKDFKAEEKCNIVSIVGRNMINITTITVSKGYCVVWINWRFPTV